MATKPRPPHEPPAAEESESSAPLHTGFSSYADELEWRRARYAHIEREKDALGRVIGVRRLKLSERTRLTAMTPDLGGLDEVQRPDGTIALIPQRAQYHIIAMVCQINDAMIPFARNRGELDAIMDRLDQEGIEAASTAVNRLIGGEEAEGETHLDKAKNLSGIPGSE